MGAQVTQIRQDIGPILQAQADDATPQRLGTYAHKELSDWLEANHGDLVDAGSGYRVRSEVSFDANGVEVPSGTAGSVRPDVVQREIVDVVTGEPAGWEVLHVYDLKTGHAGISTSWANRVTGALDPLDKPEALRPAVSPP